MAQPSVAHYFNTRKRSAVDEKIVKAKKVLILDSNDEQRDDGKTVVIKNILANDKTIVEANSLISASKIYHDKISKLERPKKVVRKVTKKFQITPNQRNIQDLINHMAVKPVDSCTSADSTLVQQTKVPLKSPDSVVNERHITPPSTPTKITNRLDNVKEASLKDIRQKLLKNNRLAELRACIAKFKEGAAKLEEAEKKTSKAEQSPTLKNFRKLEFEVNVSPTKVYSPEKAYLSPKKEPSARKNLFNILSPVKNTSTVLSSPQKELLINTKPSLTLPFKYRSLAEVFRSIDTVCQILYNRKEVITFRKLKPAVEEMLKKNLTEKHLGQIKTVFGDAFKFSQDKLRVFGSGTRQEQWELVITPNVESESITSEILLERRRKMFAALIEKLKDYHNEFLLTLDPPMNVAKDKITRWHPEFDIEKVPDIEALQLPQPPDEVKLVSGKEVLEKVKQMFNCNTRMEEAMAKLEQKRKEAFEKKTEPDEQPKEMQSVLKGIPKALLEKVRQRQAAKALMSITRSEDKEKEVQMYSRLPEIARVTRNIFVAEKKSVLPLSVVIDKLQNSFKSFLTTDEMEEHLKMISKESSGWLVFHEIRQSVFLKLSKNADLSLVVGKLNKLIQEKTET